MRLRTVKLAASALALLLTAALGCGGAEKKPPQTPTAAKEPAPSKAYDTQHTGATFDVAAPKPTPSPAPVAATPTKADKEPPPAPAPAPAAAPEDPGAQTARAESYLRQGRYEDAIRESRLALSRNEKYVPAMVVMARAYYLLGRPQQSSFVLFTRVLEPMKKGDLSVEPRDLAAIYNLLGMIDLKKGRKDQALKYFRQASEKDGNNAAAWNNLAALLVVQKDYRGAVPAAERAVALAPTLAKAQLNLGSAYRGTKQYERANTAYRRALALQAEYPEAYFNLGVLYLDADTYPGLTNLQRLETAIRFFLDYQSRARAKGTLTKDDLVEEYLKRAQSDLNDEKKSIERKRKRAEREAARKAAKAAGGATPEKGTKK
jgi:tetratricopeptide (TPR) repeat protein